MVTIKGEVKKNNIPKLFVPLQPNFKSYIINPLTLDRNMIQPAERLNLVSEYYFSRKLKEVAQLNAEGKDIISLAIGSPDMPPSEQTIEKLCEVARQPNAHGYQPTMGTPELREAMA